MCLPTTWPYTGRTYSPLTAQVATLEWAIPLHTIFFVTVTSEVIRLSDDCMHNFFFCTRGGNALGCPVRNQCFPLLDTVFPTQLWAVMFFFPSQKKLFLPTHISYRYFCFSSNPGHCSLFPEWKLRSTCFLFHCSSLPWLGTFDLSPPTGTINLCSPMPATIDLFHLHFVTVFSQLVTRQYC